MRILSGVLSSFLATFLAISPLPMHAQVSAGISNEAIRLQTSEDDAALRVSSHSSAAFHVVVIDDAGAPVSDAAVVFRLPSEGATGTFRDGTHSSVVYTDASGKAEAANIDWNGVSGPMSIRVTATKDTAHAGILIERTLQPSGSAGTSPAIAATTALRPTMASFAPAARPVAMVLPPVSSNSAPAPGTVAEPLTVSPVQHALPASSAVREDPAISITSASPDSGSHSRKKWLIIAGLAAAAGVGAMFVFKGKSSSSDTPSTSGVSVGTPVISVGHP